MKRNRFGRSNFIRGVGLTAAVLFVFLAGVVYATGAEKKLDVFVSIPPQAYFVERIGNPHVTVHVLVKPGQSPATFEPTPKQMAQLSQADVYFRIGLPFESKLLSKIQATVGGLRIVDIRKGVPLRHVEGSHGKGTVDPHIWLSPKLAKKQAETICEELCRLDSEHEAEYQKNLAALHHALDSLDSAIARALAPLKGRKFYVFHPSYGYFADAYGLKQVAVEVEGKEPSARQLAHLIEQAQADGVKVVFVQPQFSSKSAQALAEAIGGVVVPLDPLAYDYLENLREMADKISRGLQP